MEQITTAITVMALITTLAGLAVLFTIVHEQAQSRQRDVALLKILGANFALIRQLALAELFMLGAAASFWGGLMGLLASYILSTQVFQTQWQLALEIPLTVGIAVTLVALCTGMLGAARSLRTPPLSLLHGGDVA